VATTKKLKLIGVKWITRGEMDAIVDARARSVLKISGKRFASNWKAGKYRKLDSETCPGVIELALLASLPRRSSVRQKSKRSDR
jgi:hypothetical protein